MGNDSEKEVIALKKEKNMITYEEKRRSTFKRGSEKVYAEKEDIKKRRNRKMKQELRTVQGKERRFQYILTRKAVKNLNMRIKPNSEIHVSANRFVPVKYIDSFVLSHEKTLIKTLDKYEKIRANTLQPLQYVSGEKVRFLGEDLHLLVEAAGIEEAEKIGQFLFLRVKDTTDFVRKERVMKKWFSRMQADIFLEICKEIYPLFKSYGVKYPLVKIRNMKTRWGSCQPQRGIITLNGKMIAAKREAIEYVVLHEFAHFIHPNHSKEFYGLVESLMPDWKERKAMLREIG